MCLNSECYFDAQRTEKNPTEPQKNKPEKTESNGFSSFKNRIYVAR